MKHCTQIFFFISEISSNNRNLYSGIYFQKKIRSEILNSECIKNISSHNRIVNQEYVSELNFSLKIECPPHFRHLLPTSINTGSIFFLHPSPWVASPKQKEQGTQKLIQLLLPPCMFLLPQHVTYLSSRTLPPSPTPMPLQIPE